MLTIAVFTAIAFTYSGTADSPLHDAHREAHREAAKVAEHEPPFQEEKEKDEGRDSQQTRPLEEGDDRASNPGDEERGPAPPFQQQCRGLAHDDLVSRAVQGTPGTLQTERGTELTVFPAGAPFEIVVSTPSVDGFVYCVALGPLRVGSDGQQGSAADEDGPTDVLVISSNPSTEPTEGATRLSVLAPDIRFGPALSRELVLVSFPVEDGWLLLEEPKVSVVRAVKVTSRFFPVLVAALAVALAYVVAVAAVAAVRDERLPLNPVELTAGHKGKASLSQFQVLAFTLLVVGMLFYLLLRMRMLADISQDVLLLLGISAVGTAGSKMTAVANRRLSLENWSWLHDRDWLRLEEDGTDNPAKTDARWSDLLMTDGRFDVYSFQLALVSTLVAVALIRSDLSDLASFSIPQNLLALLGLSNVVYIGAKATGPASYRELNDKLNDVRQAELEWLAGVSKETQSIEARSDKIKKAKEIKPDKYQAYMQPARESAVMLRSLFGADGTKFKTGPIGDDDLVPPFP